MKDRQIIALGASVGISLLSFVAVMLHYMFYLGVVLSLSSDAAEKNDVWRQVFWVLSLLWQPYGWLVSIVPIPQIILFPLYAAALVSILYGIVYYAVGVWQKKRSK